MYHFVLVSIIVCVLIMLEGCATSDSSDPEPQVYSHHLDIGSNDGLFPGEWALIGVDVLGSTVTNPTTKPKVDIVFLVDESGSMDVTDPTNIRRSAILSVLTGLNPAHHRAAIVAFGSNVTSIGSSVMTTDFDALITGLLTIPNLGVFTNMSDAMDLANTLFAGSTAHHRIAILLTDGHPASYDWPTYDSEQDAKITNEHVPFAITNDINYSVVHLVSSEWIPEGTSLLQNTIATGTDGNYYTASNASQITTLIPEIVNEASTTLTIKDATIHMDIRMGANEYGAIDSDNIFVAGADEVDVGSSMVSTSPRDLLGSGEAISLRVPITSFEPIPSGSPPSETEISLPVFKPTTARLDYHLGDGVTQSKALPQVFVTWLRAPSVLVLKRFNASTMTVSISVTNFHINGPITGVRLREIVAGNFEIDYATVQPPPLHILQRVSKQYDITRLLWSFGSIAPRETKEVTFQVRYLGPVSGNVFVDMQKPAAEVRYSDPSGVEHSKSSRIQLSPEKRWYGDLTIDAEILNLAQPTDAGSDLFIASSHPQSPTLSDMTQTPVPSALGMWNDTFPFDQNVSFSNFASAESVKADKPNALWIRVENRGDMVTQSGVMGTVYASFKYDAQPADWDDHNWIELGDVVISNTPILPGHHVIQHFEWRPQSVFSVSALNRFISAGYLDFKVVINHDDNEKRYNNNTAFHRAPFIP